MDSEVLETKLYNKPTIIKGSAYYRPFNNNDNTIYLIDGFSSILVSATWSGFRILKLTNYAKNT